MKKDNIDFLKNLQHEMLTQETYGQADPIFWVVRQKVKVYGVSKDCSDGIEIRYDDEAIADGLESLSKYLMEKEKDLNIKYIDEYWREYVLINKEKIEKVEDLVKYMHNNLNYDSEKLFAINYSIEDKVTDNTMFITLNECKQHIEDNLHHYQNPYPYAMTAWRSPQVEKLFEILQTTNWDDVK